MISSTRPNDRGSYHDRPRLAWLREGDTILTEKTFLAKESKEWQTQDPFDWKKSRCLCRSEQRQGYQLLPPAGMQVKKVRSRQKPG